MKRFLLPTFILQNCKALQLSEKVDVRGKSIHVLRSGHGEQVENLLNKGGLQK